MSSWLIAWGVVFVASIVVELSTVALVSIWLAAGAVVAAVMALLGCPGWSQIVACIVVAVVLCVLFYKKMSKRRLDKTNIDSVIGKEGFVTEMIDNIHETGRVQISGISWAAKSASQDIIPLDTVVTVKEIKGVHVLVEKKEGREND